MKAQPAARPIVKKTPSPIAQTDITATQQTAQPVVIKAKVPDDGFVQKNDGVPTDLPIGGNGDAGVVDAAQFKTELSAKVDATVAKYAGIAAKDGLTGVDAELVRVSNERGRVAYGELEDNAFSIEVSIAKVFVEGKSGIAKRRQEIDALGLRATLGPVAQASNEVHKAALDKVEAAFDQVLGAATQYPPSSNLEKTVQGIIETIVDGGAPAIEERIESLRADPGIATDRIRQQRTIEAAVLETFLQGTTAMDARKAELDAQAPAGAMHFDPEAALLSQLSQLWGKIDD